MRPLDSAELRYVSGGCDLPAGYEPGDEIPTCDGKRRKGNNGFGNGGDDGVPGHSDKQDVTR